MGRDEERGTDKSHGLLTHISLACRSLCILSLFCVTCLFVHISDFLLFLPTFYLGGAAEQLHKLPPGNNMQ